MKKLSFTPSGSTDRSSCSATAGMLFAQPNKKRCRSRACAPSSVRPMLLQRQRRKSNLCHLADAPRTCSGGRSGVDQKLVLRQTRAWPTAPGRQLSPPSGPTNGRAALADVKTGGGALRSYLYHGLVPKEPLRFAHRGQWGAHFVCGAPYVSLPQPQSRCRSTGIARSLARRCEAVRVALTAPLQPARATLLVVQ